jgi:hypothetical protein
LCPSCSQKRTLLFVEYMNEQLLLRLPHRQMVFTFPKVLRVFFRHDRNLSGEVSRLVYRMIQSFSNEAAGRRIQSAAVIAYASAGDFVRFNPHLHGIFLEGGFNRQGRFVHIPTRDLARLARYFRAAWSPSSSLAHQRAAGQEHARVDPQRLQRRLCELES